MRDPDPPEKYAFMYLRSEDEVEIFEKFKELQDFCQKKNVPCLLVGVTKPREKDSGFALHYLHYNTVEQDKIHDNFDSILGGIDCFLRATTDGKLQITHHDASGEEWKT